MLLCSLFTFSRVSIRSRLFRDVYAAVQRSGRRVPRRVSHLSSGLEKGVTPIRLILVGIGVNAGFNALLLIFQLKMDPHDFMQAAVWISGSIWGPIGT